MATKVTPTKRSRIPIGILLFLCNPQDLNLRTSFQQLNLRKYRLNIKCDKYFTRFLYTIYILINAFFINFFIIYAFYVDITRHIYYYESKGNFY